MEYPGGKKFAFTIIDDTDDAFLDGIRKVYDFLHEKGIFTTKTVWVYPPRDEESTGHSLQHEGYREFVREIQSRGYEIGLHNVGSGAFVREEVEAGLEAFREILGQYPKIHINHSYNQDSIYGGHKRFSFPFNHVVKRMHPAYARLYQGEIPDSPYFWGDIHKRLIRYNRNYETDQLNTLRFDPHMPYIDPGKADYTNRWFSATFCPNQLVFNERVTRAAIDKLQAQGGLCILYTHLGYYTIDGQVDRGFIETMSYLADKKDCWFAPVSDMLDFLAEQKSADVVLSRWSQWRMEAYYLYVRLWYRYIHKIDDHTFKKMRAEGRLPGQALARGRF